MNDLRKFFELNTERLIHKWVHYFDIYEKYLCRYRNKKVTILEIGVSQGGSLQMWQYYFGKDTVLIGVDINPACKDLENKNTKIFIGDQEDRCFLKDLKKKIPKIDILIDDGGHTMQQQIITFEELYDHVKEDGVYICEDLHTSYWPLFGGGYKREGTFIEYSKCFIDQINAWHYSCNTEKGNKLKNTAYSIHYYDSILVIEKRRMTKPYHKATGEILISEEVQEKTVKNYNWESSHFYKKPLEDKYIVGLETINKSLNSSLVEKDKYIVGLKTINKSLNSSLVEKDKYIVGLETINKSLNSSLVEKDKYIVGLETINKSLNSSLVEKDKYIVGLETINKSLNSALNDLNKT